MLHDLFLRLSEWRRTQREVRRLKGFDDYLLADMGIARDDIEARVTGRR